MQLSIENNNELSRRFEIDINLFYKTAKFYVYTHAKPNGDIFYVGKGSGKRAWDFSPSRRTKHHINIINKYGRNNIKVTIIPCEWEYLAFKLERALISGHRYLGVALINLTDGGEGAAGRKFSAERIENHREAVKRGWKKRKSLMPIKVIIAKPARYCKNCQKSLEESSKRKIFCTENCGQNYSRDLKKKETVAQYSSNTSGHKGVYYNKRTDKWTALIGINHKIIFLGSYKDKDDAIIARKKAELKYSDTWRGGKGAGRS